MAKQVSSWFPTVSGAERWCQEKIHRTPRYRAGEPLDTFDHQALLSILSNHPEAAVKIGVGVKHFYVRQHANYPSSDSNWGFWIERIDGSVEDFSYIIAINGRSLNHEMRMVVSGDIVAWKQAQLHNGIVMCGKCLAVVLSWDGSEVDHVFPNTFRQLRDAWLLEEGIMAKDVPLLPGVNMDGGRLRDSWRAYHDTHKVLRLLCMPCHQSIS